MAGKEPTLDRAGMSSLRETAVGSTSLCGIQRMDCQWTAVVHGCERWERKERAVTWNRTSGGKSNGRLLSRKCLRARDWNLASTFT